MVPSLRKIMLLIIVAGCGSFPPSSYGSGSYLSRPPQPGLIDSQKYELGKAVFMGKVQSGSFNTALLPAQLPRLEAFQSSLPAKARQSAKLSALAGKITEPQMAALEYYLKVRFKLTR